MIFFSCPKIVFVSQLPLFYGLVPIILFSFQSHQEIGLGFQKVSLIFTRFTNRVTRSVLGNTKPDLLRTAPSLRGSCVKVRPLYFWYRSSNPLSKSFINGMVIFQTKTTFLFGMWF